jgi:hypothetical protein
MDPDVETLDLASLAEALKTAFDGRPPSGYVRGRTALRDELAQRIGCSIAAAERVVDTMVGRGFLRFQGDPTLASDAEALWSITTVA